MEKRISRGESLDPVRRAEVLLELQKEGEDVEPTST
jgi:hypothetical protein